MKKKITFRLHRGLRIPRGLFLVLLILASCIVAAFIRPGKTVIPEIADQPNVIIILTDDQGYGDVGFNGCTDIPTPNIDRIDRNGVVFRQAYVTYSVCAPSRAGLLTGRYQDRFGYSRNPLYRPDDSMQGLSLQEQLLPEVLRQHGYKTMGIGKWHLGSYPVYRPWNRGFDEYVGFLGGGHRYFPEELNIRSSDSAFNETQSYRTLLMRNETPYQETEYLTDAFSREAVHFIRQHKAQPFFLYLAYNAPHTPLQATEKYLARFTHIKDPKRKTYAAMVSAVDDGVGTILNTLYELKLTRNTLVIFLSDNGGPEQDNSSDNGVLRGGKGSLFEGGIRVPFAMQWPDKIRAGTEYKQPVSSLDIFATVAAQVKGLRTRNPLDGANLIPYLNGKKTTPPHAYLFWRQYDPWNFAVVSGSGYKEILIRDSAAKIYQLTKDISEQQDLSAGKKAQLQELEGERKKWTDQLIPPAIWGLNQEKQYKKGQSPNQ